MLLQTNSYVVPRERRAEHARLVRRFRQTLARLGCDQFEVYEQVGANWASDPATGRFVQMMRFRDRRHQLQVQAAERNDPVAQALIAEFCEIINFPYQQQQGLFATGFYAGALTPSRPAEIAGAPLEASGASSSGESEPHSDQAEPTIAATAISPPPSAEVPVAIARAGVNPFADGAPVSEAALAPEAPASAPGASAVVKPTEPPQNTATQAKPAPDDEFDLESWEVRLEPDEAGPASAAELDELIARRFGSSAKEPAASGNGRRDRAPGGGSGIGEVLDAGVMDHSDLDEVMPGELVDESSPPDLKARPLHVKPGDERGTG